jgi:CubicO group peptidase (beta-lactamase class C family)
MDIQNLEAKINQITNDYVSKRKNVVLTIGMIQKGQHYTQEFGQVSDANRSLAHAQTMYEIGSVTKVFTGRF